MAVLYEQTAAFGEALVRRHGIPSRGAFNVLAILHGAGEPLPPSTIASRMIVTRPTMTGLLGTLERRALITRVPHPTDGRMALVSLTPRARAQVESFRPGLHAAEKQWVGCLTEAEQQMFLRMLAKLQANAPLL